MRKLPENQGEIPVGAVVVQNGEIIASGYNLREKTHSAAAHAEIVALSRAGEKLKRWQLYDCDLYVTLQPCEMCRGAIAQARFKSVYFGAYDKNTEFVMKNIQVYGGIMEDECTGVLNKFFEGLR